jgi:hypothetical protein
MAILFSKSYLPAPLLLGKQSLVKLMPILLTFYKRLLRQYSSAKKTKPEM